MTERERNYQLIFENMAQGVFYQNADGSMADVNPAALRIFGLSREEFLNRGPGTAGWRLLKENQEEAPPDQHPAMVALRTGAEVRDFVAGICPPVQKPPIWVRMDAFPLFRTGERSPYQVLVCLDDRRAESELLEVKELFTLFMKYSPIYTFIKKLEGERSRVLLLSDNFIDMVGRPAEELRGRTMEEMFPPEFARKITEDDIAVVKEGKVVHLEEELNGLKYTTIKFPILREGRESLLAGFTINVTEQRRAEQERDHLQLQMFHSQKLESLGVLAGGIAHDFNNILTSIMGNTELALLQLPPGSPAVENLRRLEKATRRAAELVKQMLAYSGKGKFAVELVDMNRLVEEMVHMLESSISKKASLRLNFTRPLRRLRADATQMRQIVMNLVINASEALGEAVGEIAVTTAQRWYDKAALQQFWFNEELEPGWYVSLVVSDTGCGITQEHQARVFDPFFSTKFTGRGLGMAAVLGILRGHKGAIKLESEVGLGTTFTVVLPAKDETFEAEEATRAARGTFSGKRVVLLVDDEEAVCDLVGQMLALMGYEVVTARDGGEAVEIYQSRSDIDFVLLDLTMPVLDGEQAFEQLRRINPEVQVVITSGYSEQEVAKRFAGKGVSGFLQKPFDMSALREAIP